MAEALTVLANPELNYCLSRGAYSMLLMSLVRPYFVCLSFKFLLNLYSFEGIMASRIVLNGYFPVGVDVGEFAD